MLPDQVIQLLTAFVDGELSQRQRKAVMRLLEKSAQARQLLKELQENAHKIKKLPRHKLEPSVVAEVLQAIAASQAEPKQPTRVRGRGKGWLPYLVAGMAASILLGTLGIIYWKNVFEPARHIGPVVVNPQDRKPEWRPDVKPSPVPKKQNPLVAEMVGEVARCFVAPVPKEQFFTARFEDLRDAKGVKADRLSSELGRAKKSVHLDVAVKNDSIAMDRLRSVLKYRGITIIDAPGKKQAKVEYLVYADNFTSDEVTKLMSELGETFVVSQGNNQRDEPTPFKNLAVKAVGKEDRQNLVKFLGIDPLAVEPRAAEPGVKRDRVAILIPITGGAPIPEATRQLLQKRKPQVGTLQLVIRIRQD